MMVCGGRLPFLIHASTTDHHTGQDQHAEQQQHEKQQEELQPLLALQEGVARVSIDGPCFGYHYAVRLRHTAEP